MAMKLTMHRDTLRELGQFHELQLVPHDTIFMELLRLSIDAATPPHSHYLKIQALEVKPVLHSECPTTAWR